MISILSSLLLASLAVPAVPQDPPHTDRTTHGIPGSLPGTEAWLVTFKTRPFDLSEFRRAIHERRSPEVVDRIVADLEARMRAHQKPFVEFVESLGGRVTHQWWLVNGCAVEIPFARLDELRAHPNVLYLHPDRVVEPLTPIKTSTNAANHGTDIVQNAGLRGKGVTVAIMDTGLDANTANGTANRPHATFFIDGNVSNKTGGGIGGSRLLANVKVGAMPPDNSHPHGTGVAGIAAGGKWNSSSVSDHGHAPHAGIVGYSIANNSGGGSTFSVITTAWQKIAADRARYKIVAANNSYSGSPDPTNPSQQALDAAALNADVLPVVAAGNSSSSTRASQSCANGLAVAAVSPNTRKMAAFSSRGPLSGDTQRFYPDISANGVGTVMPRNENESSTYNASGTSMASPQVCGAATLYRSVKTTANHLETKVALLVSTEDISAKNPSPPYNTRNAYGMGYLRVDTLMTKFLSAGKVVNDKLTAASSTKKYPLNVIKGRAYAVAVAWDRLTVTSKNWSNLDLEIRSGSTTLAASATPRNLYEKVVFIAKATGTVDMVVVGKFLEKSTVPFALAAMEVPPPFISGSIASYGTGCKGTGKGDAFIATPTQYQDTMGNSASIFPLGYRPHRYQQINDAAFVPSQLLINGVAFRHPRTIVSTGAGWADIDIKVGLSSRTPRTISQIFAQNISGTLTTIFTRKRVNLPQQTARNTNPKAFVIKIPADRPYVYRRVAGKNLLFDFTQYARSTGTAFARYYVDAFYDRTSYAASRVYSTTPTATRGYFALGFGAVIGIPTPAGAGAVPLLAGSGKPNIGTSYALSVSKARASSPAALITGISDKKFGAFNLPLDLTFIGMPGCKMLASGESVLAFNVNNQGSASLNIAIPNDKSLIQAKVFHQTAIRDLPANTLGVVTTNGVRVIVGGQP